MCAVDDFQRLIFENSQSSDKFAWKPKIVSDPNISQERLKEQINVYIYIAHHIRGQWHILIYPQTVKTPLLERYSFPVTCLTHKSPSCHSTSHPPNTVQWHLSTVLVQDVTQLINMSRCIFHLIVNFSRLTYSWGTHKIWVISPAQLWIQYLSYLRLYCHNFQVNSPTCTLTLMMSKIPAWVFCVLTLVKSMIILQQHLG